MKYFRIVSICICVLGSLYSLSVYSQPKQDQVSNITLQAVRLHNQVRNQVQQPPLIPSKDLEIISQQWANQLSKSCKMYHHKGNIPFGENLFISSTSTTIGHAVNLWAAEKNDYNYKPNRCNPGKQCGHYTQIVWKGTKELGCAMQSCSNGSQIYVCSYFPAGNIVGARPF